MPGERPACTAIAIGGVTVGIRTRDPRLRRIVEARYEGFIDPQASPDYLFDVDEHAPDPAAADAEIRVFRTDDRWHIERGDFHAEWETATRRGRIRQSANPYSTDTVLRVVHTLVLAGQGGFLLHAASAVRDGAAFVFAGESGAGKTTISRLAPAGVQLLTDEISYVRRRGEGYDAYGTPFAGDLGRAGENTSAPVAALLILCQDVENRVEPLDPPDAVHAVLRNLLFFAEDPALVRAVFRSALEFVERVPVRRLRFRRDPGVWDLIRAADDAR